MLVSSSEQRRLLRQYMEAHIEAHRESQRGISKYLLGTSSRGVLQCSGTSAAARSSDAVAAKPGQIGSLSQAGVPSSTCILTADLVRNSAHIVTWNARGSPASELPA